MLTSRLISKALESSRAALFPVFLSHSLGTYKEDLSALQGIMSTFELASPVGSPRLSGDPIIAGSPQPSGPIPTNDAGAPREGLKKETWIKLGMFQVLVIALAVVVTAVIVADDDEASSSSTGMSKSDQFYMASAPKRCFSEHHLWFTG